MNSRGFKRTTSSWLACTLKTRRAPSWRSTASGKSCSGCTGRRTLSKEKLLYLFLLTLLSPFHSANSVSIPTFRLIFRRSCLREIVIIVITIKDLFVIILYVSLRRVLSVPPILRRLRSTRRRRHWGSPPRQSSERTEAWLQQRTRALRRGCGRRWAAPFEQQQVPVKECSTGFFEQLS